MGRIRLLPSGLARIHPHWRSPHIAVILQFIVAVGLSLWLGFKYDPVTAFFLIATMAVVAIVPIYIACNLACFVYYRRHQRAEFNPVLHLVIPVLGILVMVPAFLAAAGLPVFSFISRLTYPLSLAGIVVGIWMVIGIVYLLILYNTNRQRILDTGRVFEEEEPEALRAGEEPPPAFEP